MPSHTTHTIDRRPVVTCQHSVTSECAMSVVAVLGRLFGYRPRKNPLLYNLQNDAIARKAVIRTHLTAGTQDLRVAFISIRIRHDDPIVGFLRRVDFGSSSRGGGRHWNLFVGQFRPGKFCRLDVISCRVNMAPGEGRTCCWVNVYKTITCNSIQGGFPATYGRRYVKPRDETRKENNHCIC